MQASLLGLDIPHLGASARAEQALDASLGQWMTPAWAAEAIVAHHYGALAGQDKVLEPSCGRGAFLSAIPSFVQAIGVEIDEDLAREARERTGRSVVCADFLSADLPDDFSLVLGNPPFDSDLVQAFMDKAYRLLRPAGEVGFVLPAYVFQASSTVMRYSSRWGISQQLMPRNLFPNLKLPLVFARFQKSSPGKLFGFLLYRETEDMRGMNPAMREMANANGRGGSVWRRVVNAAFDGLGAGAHSLGAIYRAIEGRRPTGLETWRAQVRKVLQTYEEFRPSGNGAWARCAQV